MGESWATEDTGTADRLRLSHIQVRESRTDTGDMKTHMIPCWVSMEGRWSCRTTGPASPGHRRITPIITRHATGERRTRESTRQVNCRRPMSRRCRRAQVVISLSSQCATASLMIGARASAPLMAQAMPSPVNGSTYPAASPTANQRGPAMDVGRCVRDGVPRQSALSMSGTAAPPASSRIIRAAAGKPPASRTKDGSNAAARSSSSVSRRTMPM